MASCETVENVFKKEIDDIQKLDKALAVRNVHRKPFTESLTQSVHAWQGEQKRVRREGENFDFENVKDQCLVLKFLEPWPWK